MKILNLLYKPNFGGVGQAFMDYGSSLIDQGNEVAIVISKKDKLCADYSSFCNIFKLKHLSPVTDSFKLLLVIKKYKPDIIICHDPRSIRLACNIKRFIKSPIVGVNHGIGIKQSLRSDFILNVNNQIRQKTIDAGFDESKTFLVRNMINMEGLKLPRKVKFNKPVRIGIIGRIESRKGFDILARALSILKKSNIDFIAKFGGFTSKTEGYLSDLKELIKKEGLVKKIEFPGKIVDKKSFYENIDILVVPSREEPFGIVMLEAFKYSVPVISSETNGAKILIKNNENGLTFPIGNHEELAKKLEFLINNEEFAKKLVENAFSSVTKDYSYKSVGKDINGKLNKILGV